jgi:agmatine deiminase
MINRRKTLGMAAAGIGLLPFSAQRAMARSAGAAGFRMPLESGPHLRTFMQWPAAPAIYGGDRPLDDVRDTIARIAAAIVAFEPVVMLARPDQIPAAAKRVDPRIEFWPVPTDDLWCRDSGPTCVTNDKGELAVSEIAFNGWGNKQQHAHDGQIASRIAKELGLPFFANGIVGEGGGVEVDGAGTALAHASSWVNPNRNAGTRDEVERLLLDALGAEKMIWAPGIAGADITDYHIDALARFVKPGQVVIQLPDAVDRSDHWSVAAFETYDILKQARDAAGRKLDIVVIPDPVDIRVGEEDFVASYVNYYVCNGAVITAAFGDDTADATAQEILGELYPGRSIIALDVDPLGAAGGGIHCATQQQPG